MRGALASYGTPCRRRWIIPAHAGSTWAMMPSYRPRQDHPRTCGEHGDESQLLNIISGSSPHMRGALPYGGVCCMCNRIIPAHAGSTIERFEAGDPQRDHPRTCGEHPLPLRRRDMGVGSSPHMRGALLKKPVNVQRDGDHPRTCGEHSRSMLRSM